jgi:hypothetical protein
LKDKLNNNRKIVVKNDFQNSIILCVEPWAVEYGMMPNDEFEIIADNSVNDFYFHLVFGNKRITIFVEGGEISYPQVLQDGKLLDYGHNSF